MATDQIFVKVKIQQRICSRE